MLYPPSQTDLLTPAKASPQVPSREGISLYSLIQCLPVFRLINWYLLRLPCLNTSSIVSGFHNLTQPLLEHFSPILSRTRHSSVNVFVPFLLYSTAESRKRVRGISQHLRHILKMQREGLGTLENAHTSTRQTLLHPSQAKCESGFKFQFIVYMMLIMCMLLPSFVSCINSPGKHSHTHQCQS